MERDGWGHQYVTLQRKLDSLKVPLPLLYNSQQYLKMLCAVGEICKATVSDISSRILLNIILHATAMCGLCISRKENTIASKYS